VVERRGGLGRGLGAVFGATDQAEGDGGVEGAGGAVAGARLVELAPSAIGPNRAQPRTDFDETALAELVLSIREVGVLQPVVVRARPEGEEGPPYELVMGERRWRAARAAGLPTLPAIVRTTSDDALLRDALLENLHRQQLNPLEEAAAYQQLLAEFGATHEQLATRIGRSRPQISNTIRLLQLPGPVQRRVAAGVLSAGHARALLGLEEAQAQEQLAGRIVAEGLSVRAVEEIVALGAAVSPPAERRSRSAAEQPAQTAQAQRALSDALETAVAVTLRRGGAGRGTITITVADAQDLERVVRLIVDGAAAG